MPARSTTPTCRPLSRKARSHQPATRGHERPGRAISQRIITPATPRTISGTIMRALPKPVNPSEDRHISGENVTTEPKRELLKTQSAILIGIYGVDSFDRLVLSRLGVTYPVTFRP